MNGIKAHLSHHRGQHICIKKGSKHNPTRAESSPYGYVKFLPWPVVAYERSMRHKLPVSRHYHLSLAVHVITKSDSDSSWPEAGVLAIKLKLYTIMHREVAARQLVSTYSAYCSTYIVQASRQVWTSDPDTRRRHRQVNQSQVQTLQPSLYMCLLNLDIWTHFL
jgi:hypothetical protein